MGTFIDLTGQKFNSLTALSSNRQLSGKQLRTMWVCLCDCGNKTKVPSHDLRNNRIKSCGCYRNWDRKGHPDHPRAIAYLKKHKERLGVRNEWYSQAGRIMSYAKTNNIRCGFSSITEFALYIRGITPDRCPVFDEPLTRGTGRAHDYSPSVDRIIPRKGYVRGNIQVISLLANMMKQDASPRELKQFAEWSLKEKKNAATH